MSVVESAAQCRAVGLLLACALSAAWARRDDAKTRTSAYALAPEPSEVSPPGPQRSLAAARKAETYKGASGTSASRCAVSPWSHVAAMRDIERFRSTSAAENTGR